jgi:Spy/CpxP family protein refolding chaperone
MTRKSLLALACLAAFSAPLTFAQGPGMGSMPRHEMGEGMHGMAMGPSSMWWKNEHIIQLLTLTPEQQKKMSDIFEKSRIQLIDLHANVEKAEIPMEALLAANPPDTAKVISQIDKLAQARAELEKADARMLLGIRGVLTPDQWTKLQAEEHSHRGMGSHGDEMKRGSQQGQGRPSGGRGGPGGPQGQPPAPPTA